MARAKRTDSGIYIGVIRAGRTDGIEKERPRRENLAMIWHLCLLTIVLFDPNRVVQPYQPHLTSTINTLADIGVRSELQTRLFKDLQVELCTTLESLYKSEGEEMVCGIPGLSKRGPY